MDKRIRTGAAAAGVILGIGAGIFFLMNRDEDPPVSSGGPRPGWGAFLVGTWKGQTVEAPDELDRSHLGVYVAARGEGTLRADAWEFSGKTAAEALQAAMKSARGRVKEGAPVDTLLGCIARDFRDVDADDVAGWNVHRGVRGLELSAGEAVRRVSPFEMLARNESFDGMVRDFVKDLPQGMQRWAESDVSIRAFECDQFYVPLSRPNEARAVLRGNDLVGLGDLSEQSVERFFSLMGDWMFANLMTDGRMLYKWWPSRNEESNSNNQIRQWMASLALIRVAEIRNDPALVERSAANLRYNVAHFYREENGLGLIDDQGKVKLGAIALAALALHRHPNAKEFEAQKQTLVATTFSMQAADGGLDTLLIPKDPSRPFQNFYTGEALLLWAALYTDNRDPALLERYMKSFRYYRTWHRENRNPAFIPWHTQADYQIWKLTKDKELADFIFEMNDWLLGVQDWKKESYVDVKGQFYDSDRPDLGPPHASSTGVYLEGLADAYALAVALGDKERAKKYRRAIRGGVRASIQLQYQDELDLFYVPLAERPRSLGGLRTRVYHNEIRVDNIQHTLLGVDKILRVFKAEDWK